MRDDPVLTDLVAHARNGDKQAWDALVERYASLIWSICRRYRLGRADVGHVSQSVWLQLVDRLATIQDPAALTGWLATTTRRECEQVLRAARGTHAAAGYTADAETIPDEPARTVDQDLLAEERRAAFREAFVHLPACCQQLIALLIEDPPIPYAQISARVGIPAGSIEPNRGRCLDKLRRHPAIAALINAQAEIATRNA
jgi:RNA polymerase sigma factor (sigma-70 family)